MVTVVVAVACSQRLVTEPDTGGVEELLLAAEY
jgi:hypothetical protein